MPFSSFFCHFQPEPLSFAILRANNLSSLLAQQFSQCIYLCLCIKISLESILKLDYLLALLYHKYTNLNNEVNLSSLCLTFWNNIDLLSYWQEPAYSPQSWMAAYFCHNNLIFVTILTINPKLFIDFTKLLFVHHLCQMK